MKFKDGGSVVDHLNEFENVVNQLATMKIVLDDELQAFLILRPLPNSWKTLVVTVFNSACGGVLSTSQVTSSMFNEEIRRKTTNIDSNIQALTTENRRRSKKAEDRSVTISLGEGLNPKRKLSAFIVAKKAI